MKRKDNTKPTRVFSADPFKVELYETENTEYSKAVVTMSNNSIRYEFSPASEMYWYISFMGQDAEALKMLLTLLTLSTNFLSVDVQFMRDMFRTVNDAIERKNKEGADAAKAVTEEDEEEAKEFMDGVAKKIDALKEEKAKKVEKK